MKKLIYSLLVCLLLLSLCACGNSNKVSLSNYILPNEELAYTGCDGYATLATDVDDILNLDDLVVALTEGEGNLLTYDSISRYITVSIIEPSTDNQKHLSNGDKITYEITVDTDSINNLGLAKKLDSKNSFEVSYTVSGLSVPVKVDPFQLIKSVYVDLEWDDYVTFTLQDKYKEIKTEKGMYYIVKNQSNSFSIVSSEEFDKSKDSWNYIGCNFEITTNEQELSNMEQVEYKISCEEDAFISAGILLSPTTKTYTLNTYKYLDSSEKITKPEFDKLKQLATESALKEAANATFVNAYLYVDNNINTSVTPNILYMIFNVDGKYRFVKWGEIKYGSDGTIKEPEFSSLSWYKYDSESEFLDKTMDSIMKQNGKITKITF